MKRSAASASARREDASKPTKIQAALHRGSFLLADQLRATTQPEDVLYVAQRDFVPPLVDGINPSWRFDRIRWSGPDLPTGELKRSIGHWNQAGQAEAFLCTEGRAYMILAEPGDAVVTIVRLEAGSVLALADRSWHLTFIASEHATVDNCYRERESVADSRDKYESDSRGPVMLSVVREPASRAVAVLNRGASPVRYRLAEPAGPPLAGGLQISDLPLAMGDDAPANAITLLGEGTLLPGSHRELR